MLKFKEPSKRTVTVFDVGENGLFQRTVQQTEGSIENCGLVTVLDGKHRAKILPKVYKTVGGCHPDSVATVEKETNTEKKGKSVLEKRPDCVNGLQPSQMMQLVMTTSCFTKKDQG